MKKGFLLSLLTASALTLPTAASAVLIDFNSAATDFTDNFTVSTGTTTGFTWGAAVGVNSTGGVTVSTDSGGANYNYNSAFTNTGTITVSTFFKTNAVTDTSANQIAGVGILAANTGEFGGTAVALGVTLRYGNGGAGSVQLAVANSTGTNTNTTEDTAFTATANNWYKLTATITKTGTADTWTVSGSVEDWGANGNVDPGTSVKSFSNQSFTNSNLYALGTVYTGFYARQTAGNPIQMQAVDNFYAVPEPSTYGLLGGALALGAAAIARRRRA